MKILVTGFNGQLGFDVVRIGNENGMTMIGTGIEELDITDQTNVDTYVKKIKPDAIIHCAAYTAVDKAEDEKEQSWKVNVEGTKYLVDAAKKNEAKFIYISTDYVFNGEGENPYIETDQPDPVSYYGITKYEGEKVVRDSLEKWFIIRISWVFGINGNNFIKTMLRLSETNSQLNVVGDQYGSPTYTYDLAKLLIDMVKTEKYGIYHVTNEGFCSWYDFANEIFRQANKEVKVNSITTDKFPTKAKRPANSKMSKQKLVDNGFKSLPDWKNAVKHYLNELSNEVK
ncbi:dTDP-4-dehydrorhamnose reductase [Evansella cellulosilytica]|uniref:dTDP-4-dehydrorhamnose reductase n=1 Tax=Evansella cellulosilytica (strain ATCC 21833 / DSM 2522 / FERM P-1141 / JCM 9156 / N-4) TaxID=649639 RepID=E6TT20_EVAC2|nr:dTDP-4-dehydrorhamnose reductase [Evansella cellulosilytica]ADU31928.1 dTDP-4-dehydrorhamnose reductase [Evansella cellulosilytica DSM 2522]